MLILEQDRARARAEIGPFDLRTCYLTPSPRPGGFGIEAWAGMVESIAERFARMRIRAEKLRARRARAKARRCARAAFALLGAGA